MAHFHETMGNEHKKKATPRRPKAELAVASICWDSSALATNCLRPMVLIIFIVAVNFWICGGFIISSPGHKHRATVVRTLNHEDDRLESTVITNSGAEEKNILRQLDKWACIKNCGACCKLGPLSSRPDLASYLTKAELKMYQSMIGPDDWCKNFDQSTRMCNIYDTRPDFCRVEPKKFKKMYRVEASELNDFCTFCCTEQIQDVYGEASDEMHRFNEVIESLT